MHLSYCYLLLTSIVFYKVLQRCSFLRNFLPSPLLPSVSDGSSGTSLGCFDIRSYTLLKSYYFLTFCTSIRVYQLFYVLSLSFSSFSFFSHSMIRAISPSLQYGKPTKLSSGEDWYSKPQPSKENVRSCSQNWRLFSMWATWLFNLTQMPLIIINWIKPDLIWISFWLIQQTHYYENVNIFNTLKLINLILL